MESEPAGVSAIYVAKYNKFVDNILGRINKILRTNYDPVTVKLTNPNSTKTAKGSSSKKRKTTATKKRKNSSKRNPAETLEKSASSKVCIMTNSPKNNNNNNAIIILHSICRIHRY